MNIREALTFDDVLLVPQYSSVTPTEANVSTKLGPYEFRIPIMSAAMDRVTAGEMAVAMASLGGLGVIHKNMTVEAQCHVVKMMKTRVNDAVVAAAVGVLPGSMSRVDALVNENVNILVVDTAHGHSRNVYETVEAIKNKYPWLVVVAGNIATAGAVNTLHNAGADAVKVGIGSGSICTTRSVAGVGVPQLTAIMDCVSECKGMSLIADGGVRTSGDMVKALAAGADAVMLGSMLAGALEAPGTHVEVNGVVYKEYRGMGSIGAMVDGSKDRYGQTGVANDKLVAEGVEAYIPFSGPVKNTLEKLIGGIKSGMGYLGASNLAELRENPAWVRITNAGLIESKVHSVITNLKADQ